MQAKTKTNSIPSADLFDDIGFPFGMRAGNNKYGFVKCPTCGKPPTTHPELSGYTFFIFRDSLSAMEYGISGMCQACQDSVFGK